MSHLLTSHTDVDSYQSDNESADYQCKFLGLSNSKFYKGSQNNM